MKPVVVDKPISELTPLDVKCSDTRCEQGFHYYTSKTAPKDGKVGDCKECGDSSIDWERIHQQEPKDISYIFQSLRKELLRHVCWVNDVDQDAIERAKLRGKFKVLGKAREILTKKIAKIPQGYFDYLCTPKKGKEIVHYAQHATATCCRNCVERWHKIPQDRILTESEIDYFVELIRFYIEEKIPKITEQGIESK
jgi:hypothetical protein